VNRRPPPTLLLAAAILLCAAACKPSDPKNPQTWMGRLADPDAKVRTRAVQELSKLRAREAGPQVAALLTDPLVKEEAAGALGAIGGPESVQPLLDAIDTTVGAGSDAAARAANRTNARIADALGSIGYSSAGPALLRLARARDVSVRLSAVQALGQVRAREAVPELSRMVDDPTVPPLLVKKAVVSLGQIRDAAGIPALLHALVIERQGVSFLSEASFSLFVLGEASLDPLLSVAQDQDPRYLAWARENSRASAGTYAKAAIVLGDLGDPRATPVLLKLLRYTDPDQIPSTARLLSSVVRQFAADALGRLRAKEAAAPILALVSTRSADDEEAAAFYGNALVWIGDRSQAKELLRRAQTGAVRARLSVAQAAALLGEPSLRKDLAQLAAREKDGKPKECASALAELSGVAADEATACQGLSATFGALDKPLAAAEECSAGDAAACWSKKLAHREPLIRARAAYELGRAGAASAVPDLVKQASDESLPARVAAIRALEWLVAGGAAQSQLKAAAPQLSAQLAAEQGGARFLKANDEVRRLQARVAHLQF
jgi:HEAT repeat protein